MSLRTEQTVTAPTDYLTPLPGARVFTALDHARAADLAPGDVVLVRDVAALCPESARSSQRARGKWHLRPYRLADGQSGNLLMVCDFAGDQGPAAVPPEFQVRLDLPGWYAIWIGAFLMEHSADGGGGINVALEGEPGYALIGPEAARFRGRWAHPYNCEYLCYWTCARLDQQTLRIRVPWGTYRAYPWGLVRGSFSALRLVRLSDQQAQAHREDVVDPSTKRVLAINDCPSSYWDVAEPGKKIDAQLAMAYRSTDVGKYLLQTPNTGVASWSGTATSLIGELVGQDEWGLLRRGDQRICDYVHWAVRHGQESLVSSSSSRTLTGSSALGSTLPITTGALPFVTRRGWTGCA